MTGSSSLTEWFSVSRALATAILIFALIISGCHEDGSGSISADRNLPDLPETLLLTKDPAVHAQFSQAVKLARKRPNDSKAVGRLGMIYAVYNQPVEAAACFRRAALLSSREFKWYYLLGRMQRTLGQANEAVNSLNQAIARNADYAPVHSALGEIYLELSETDRAESAFRSALQIDERSCAALIGLGKVLAGTGDHPAALTLYRRALAFAPRYAPLHYAMALSLRETAELQQAKRHFDLANVGTKQLPDRDWILASLSEMETGFYADFRRAKSKFDVGDLDASIKILRRMLAADPNNYGVRGWLALALNRKGATSEALEQYQQAISLNPDNIDFLRPYALLLARNRRLDEARGYMERIIELGGDHADDYEVLGALLSLQNRRREAIKQFELSLKRDPLHTRSRNNLVKLLYEEIAVATSDEEVLPYLIRFVELEQSQTEPYIMLGRMLDGQGDFEGALRAFDAALLLNPNIPEVRQRADELRQLLISTPPQ